MPVETMPAVFLRGKIVEGDIGVFFVFVGGSGMCLSSEGEFGVRSSCEGGLGVWFLMKEGFG